MFKVLVATVALLGGAEVSAQSSSETCTDLESCGAQTGYPYYWDPEYKPKHLHNMTRFASINAVIIPFVLQQEEYYRY